MSKAVTNEEVEDVLSSIRRLVSEDKRPLAGLRSAPSEPSQQEPVAVDESSAPEDVAAEAETAPMDHFVLTPALRVAEPEASAPDADGEAPLDLASVARKTWTDDLAEGEAPDNTEDNAPLVLFPQAEDAAEDMAQTDGEDPAMDAVDALIQDALDVEVQQNDDSDDDYGDESYWDVDDAPNDTDEAQSDVAEPAQSEEGEQETLETQDDTEAASTLPLTAKIAALEAAIGGINQDWEPDGSEEADIAAPDTPAMAWEDDVDLDANGAPMEEALVEETVDAETSDVVEDEAAPTAAAIGGDDQLLDEEALRELVSDIVRTELQGALGERITRNVRKLVRREIHRALAAQDLE
ncbi:hypothetical protein ABMC88_13295 [Sulfitobacter sp. HNIBRBA2951]|uniref:hypothetical protein n=1 Tax=Sulfitobacter aquimarinus TaxID=3158557 RepID=UPI0032DE426D